MSLTRLKLLLVPTLLSMTLLSGCHGRGSVTNPTPCVVPAFPDPPVVDFHPCTPVGVEALAMTCIEPPKLAAIAAWVQSVGDYVTAVRSCPLVVEHVRGV